MIGFTWHEANVIGTITLPLTIGTWPRVATEMAQFLIVNMPPAYNEILGRPSQITFRAIPSAPLLPKDSLLIGSSYLT